MGKRTKRTSKRSWKNPGKESEVSSSATPQESEIDKSRLIEGHIKESSVCQTPICHTPSYRKDFASNVQSDEINDTDKAPIDKDADDLTNRNIEIPILNTIRSEESKHDLNNNNSHDTAILPHAEFHQNNDLHDNSTEHSSQSLNKKNCSSYLTEYHNKSSRQEIDPETKTVNSGDSTRSSIQAQKVYVIEAQKVPEGQGRSYISYLIQYNGNTVSRRYSDFESLRNLLKRLFPMTLIPPIPEKQNLKSYGKNITASAFKYSRQDDRSERVDIFSLTNEIFDTNGHGLIRHRMHMLMRFLNKLIGINQIMSTSIITDFLDPANESWVNFVNSSSTFSSLPRSVLHCNPLDPTNTTRIHVTLPTPSLHLSKLESKKSLNGGLISETYIYYKNWRNILNNGIYKCNKRITKLLLEVKGDEDELSRNFSQFSNTTVQGIEFANEMVQLSSTFNDSSTLLIELVKNLHYGINETLDDQRHMASAATELMEFCYQKQLQLIRLKTLLDIKSDQLSNFEKRLAGTSTTNKVIDNVIDRESQKSHEINFERPNSSSYSARFMNRLNKLAGMVKESVSYSEIDHGVSHDELFTETAQLKESVEVTEGDLRIIIKSIIERELSEYMNVYKKELLGTLKCYSKYMKEYALKNLEIWKKFKEDHAKPIIHTHSKE